MLDPRGRQMLLGSLRPPEGYRFNCAVGTTFSLDLIAVAAAPLGFAMFDWQDDDGRLAADPTSGKGDPLACSSRSGGVPTASTSIVKPARSKCRLSNTFYFICFDQLHIAPISLVSKIVAIICLVWLKTT